MLPWNKGVVFVELKKLFQILFPLPDEAKTRLFPKLVVLLLLMNVLFVMLFFCPPTMTVPFPLYLIVLFAIVLLSADCK